METDRQAQRTMRLILWLFAALGLLAGLTAALVQVGGTVGQFALGLAILVTSMLAGGLLGFLFALPRVLARPAIEASVERSGTGGKLVETNSNLERVSDWLTTLLVGVGLAELGEINQALRRFSQFVANANPGCPADGCALTATIAPLLVVAGTVLGFLGMYIITRVIVVRLFDEVEKGLLSREQQRVVFGTAQRSAALGVDSPAAALLAPALKPGPVTVQDSLDVMFAQLYQNATAGYDRAIELGETLETTAAAENPDFWFYLAAAWGQKYAALKEAGREQEAQAARNQVLKAAARTIKLNEDYRRRLAGLMTADPNDAAADNDLALLVNDEALRALAGLPPLSNP